MFDYEHDRMIKLQQSTHIHHQAESQQTVRQGEEFLWSVYRWLICLPSWITEAERCSALSLPRRCRQTTKQTDLSYLQLSWGPSEALPTVVRPPWPTNPSLMLSSQDACRDLCSRAAERAVNGVGGGLFRALQRDIAGFLCLSWPGSVQCESRQSGRALLARLGFAAISRRDLHCRVCRGREESGCGNEAGREAGKRGLRWRKSWKTGYLMAR